MAASLTRLEPECEAIWRKVRELVQERTHTAAAEWKRTKDLGAVMPREQAHVLVQHLIDAVRDNVLNPLL
jgi:hypothetical protein